MEALEDGGEWTGSVRGAPRGHLHARHCTWVRTAPEPGEKTDHTGGREDSALGAAAELGVVSDGHPQDCAPQGGVLRRVLPQS